MTPTIANLIAALRHELERYKEMVALLERQQAQIAARSADDVQKSVGLVRQLGLAMQRAHAHREECRAHLAQTLQRPRQTTFAELIPSLPGDCRQIVSDLVKQNNELLARIQQRARQNHLRLARSIELIQNLVGSLFPSRITRTYNGRGNMSVRRLAPRSFYEAVG
jgi:hypothetical protein